MTDEPQTDRAPIEPSDQPTTTYVPPAEAKPPWQAASGWSRQTPEHWFEPMPGQAPIQPVRQRRSGGGFLAAMFVIALLAGVVGSGVTYYALDATGRLVPPGAPAANATPDVLSTPGATPGAAPVIANIDPSVVTRAAEAVSPAVIKITTRAGEAADPFVLPEGGVGSGIIFDSEGWVLTNRHVVDGARQVTVELHDKRKLSGTVYGEDTLTDLAIVKIDGADLPVASIGDSAQLRPGDLAVAIGSPLGTFTNSVTSGVISALGRDVPVTDPVTGDRRMLRNVIQTDAAINPGNSGGALIDAAGTVIGINTAVASEAQGIGFAIPVNIAKPLLRQALDGEPLARPWIGITYTPVNRDVADQLDLAIDYGALVSSDTRRPAITPDSPAEEAGIEDGDIITSVNGVRIDASNNLDDVLSQYQPGDRLTVQLLRGGNSRQVSVVLGTRPAGLQ
jgi:S1-C subfamily serine protease